VLAGGHDRRESGKIEGLILIDAVKMETSR
jgi:hypothetical protein